MSNLLTSIFFIQLVIFVHELGHYVIAKKVGADVYEFSVGIGPKIFQFKKNETTYILRIIPLLGHVLLQEIDLEDGENTQPIVSENNLKTKGFLSEISVYLAGPAFNFITAFLTICLIFLLNGFPTLTIGEVTNNSPAQNAGLEIGDTIIAINDKPLNNWNDVSQEINSLKKDKLPITIEKNDKTTKTIIVNPEYNKDNDFYSIGISPQFEQNIFKSISSGFVKTIEIIKDNVIAISELFLGWIPGLGNENYNIELTGPIGTIQTVSTQASQSFTSMLSLFASFNINIGVINLIPFIPILDGGQALIRTIEAIRKKAFNETLTLNLKIGGAVFIFGLMIITTIKDVINLI